MALANESEGTLRVDFDADEDVLYLSVGDPTPGYADEAADGVLLRRSSADGKLIGVTALDFRANWILRRNAFYSLVSEYLGIPPATVERSVEVLI